jgi:PilZ domain-containing protein
MRNGIAWDELGIDTLQDRRREKRRAVRLSIEVTGFGNDGRFFAERTVTTGVSESGCSFRLRRGLERGGIIGIRLLPDGQIHTSENEPFLYQVVYATRDKLDWAIGTAKLQEKSIWSATVTMAQAEVGQACSTPQQRMA